MEVVQGHLRGLAEVIRDESKTSLLVPIHTLQTSVAVEIDRGPAAAVCLGRGTSTEPRPT